jgi:Bacterial Ig-like domain (group 2).
MTKGGKYGNPLKIRVKRSLVSVKKDKKVRLRVKVTGRKMKKAGKKIRYISLDPSVAKVSKKRELSQEENEAPVRYTVLPGMVCRKK